MKKILYFLISASLLITACSQNSIDEDLEKVKKEKPAAIENPHAVTNPHANMENPHAKVENPHGDMQNPHGEIKKPTKQIVIPQEIAALFKSVILETKNIKENTTIQTEIMIGQKAEISGTPYAIELENYIPDFVIDKGGVITTRSAEENNPVAKIKVYKGGELSFDGWLYKNFPEAHGSFTDAEIQITIVKSISK